MIFQKTIAVDFDGTITKADLRKVNNIPEPRRNCARIMRQWIDEGYVVIINTLRGRGDWEIEARRYLDKYEIPFSYFNENATERIEAYGDVRKIAADIYIDDKNMGGIPEDFADIDKFVKAQIGYPYQRTENGFIEMEAHPDTPSLTQLSLAERASNPFRAKWSPKFVEQAQRCPIRSQIYNALFYGQINEYEAIEMLSNQLSQANDTITQMMMSSAFISSKTKPN